MVNYKLTDDAREDLRELKAFSLRQFGTLITREYLADMRTLPKEYLRALFLNAHNRVIRDEVISIGTVNSNIVHPREVFRSQC